VARKEITSCEDSAFLCPRHLFATISRNGDMCLVSRIREVKFKMAVN
jgi:hypothetical protein